MMRWLLSSGLALLGVILLTVPNFLSGLRSFANSSAEAYLWLRFSLPTLMSAGLLEASCLTPICSFWLAEWLFISLIGTNHLNLVLAFAWLSLSLKPAADAAGWIGEEVGKNAMDDYYGNGEIRPTVPMSSEWEIR